jgi:hypothetical protein
MSDVILIDGDQAIFMPSFGVATVAVQPGQIKASGPARVAGKSACVAGDEGNVSVKGCNYFAGQYSIPGTDTLTIASLAADQQAKTTSTGGAKLLLKGSSFTARFTVDVPAAAAAARSGFADPGP